MPEVEFDAWETPFQDGDLTVLEVRFGNGGMNLKYFKEKIGFEMPRTHDCGYEDLLVRLFCKERSAIYSVMFEEISAFRVLDENSLLQIWEETRRQGGRPGPATFKVRNHLWATESFLAFHSVLGSWSFVIATHDTCVEVVCSNPPEIRFEESVRSYRLE